MRSYSENSRDTALAAFAAWDQGKFWAMHDLIFDKAPQIDRTVLFSLAEKLGLDMKKFAAGMDDKKLLDELTETRARVRAMDIWSTPTLVINGKILKGHQPFEKYKELIDEALGSTSEGSGWHRASSALRMLISPRSAYAGKGAFGEGRVPLFVKAPALKAVNALRVGQKAPEFELPSTHGNNIKLSDYYGKKNVLLTFLPAAFTPV